MSVGGDTLAGAASGASLGAIAGPYGAVVGGVVGGAAGLISGLGKKKKRDAADAAAKNRPKYQVPQEVFQNQAMYESLAKSSRVPGQSQIENQIGQNTSQSIAASQKAAGSSADALAAIGNIQQNANNQYGELGRMGAEYQASNIDKLAQARTNTGDYRQQEFDYNQNQPWQIAFGQSQKLQDQNRQDNQNITNDVQALSAIGADQYNNYSKKGKKKTYGTGSNSGAAFNSNYDYSSNRA